MRSKGDELMLKPITKTKCFYVENIGETTIHRLVNSTKIHVATIFLFLKIYKERTGDL